MAFSRENNRNEEKEEGKTIKYLHSLYTNCTVTTAHIVTQNSLGKRPTADQFYYAATSCKQTFNRRILGGRVRRGRLTIAFLRTVQMLPILDMVSLHRPSSTEAFVMGPSSSYHDHVKERLIVVVKDHEF